MTEPNARQADGTPLEIDLDAVLRDRLPAYHRFIPDR